QLSDIYIHRLEAGDVGIVDVNKIRLELLNTQTAYDLNAQDIQSRLNELRQLNGGEPISFEATEYPQESLPATDREAWKTEMLARSADVQAAVHRESAAKQAIGVQQTNGLPKFDIGFKRDTEPSTPYNGVVVGISIPLFSNRHQVKRARAEWQAAGARRELAVTTETAAVDRLWEEAETLRGVLQSYERELRDSETIELLRLALDGGELSMINYLGEISVLYDMRTTYIELQARYRKALAQLNKGML
ncbi:MAG: TolC family protein, partial [Prevotellaceae bacterium]|nr:TolC family protein [Prevotellaceae bacterium]